MKLKEALKKFKFLKRLGLSDKIIAKLANHLAATLVGNTEVYFTPLAKRSNPIHFLVEWDDIFEQNVCRMNSPLLELERANRSKFGPRSIQIPWPERIGDFQSSYSNQDPNHLALFNFPAGEGNLLPISMHEASVIAKSTSSAGLPYLEKKGKCLTKCLDCFDELLERQDPCMLYTRTTENRKTRNVWGFPFADTLYEMRFYVPLLRYMKDKPYRAALVSPDLVAEKITDLIDLALKQGSILYSVDFKGFDNSVKYQYIIKAFEFIKSCYPTTFHPFINYICVRMHSIGIVTPTGIYKGNHGIPSGSTFTNEVDSIVQLGIAMLCKFIHESECIIQGDDGVYVMSRENIAEFESKFAYAGLKLEKSKSLIASDCVVFCQNLYHDDYRDATGFIGGIYPTYRAINRILFHERFVYLESLGMNGKDYFGIRCLTILENCKYHPLHEELVRFVLSKEKFSLDISDDSLTKYSLYLSRSNDTTGNLNHQYGSQVMGIRNFVTYKLVQKILAEEELSASE